MSGLATAAASAIGEVAGMAGTVMSQARVNADGVQTLAAQAATGKNPIFNINPTPKNDPSGYAEDDEAMVRGAAKLMAQVLNAVSATLDVVKENTAQKLVDLSVEPTLLTPGGAGMANRHAKVLSDLNKAITALTNHKDQGSQVVKPTELLLHVAKAVYQQAGSALYQEAPMLVQNARLLVHRGSTVLTEGAEVETQAENELHRVKRYVVSANKLVELIDGDHVAVVQGNVKLLQRGGAKTITWESKGDFVIKSLDGAVKLEAQTNVLLSAMSELKALSSTLNLFATGSAKLAANGTLDLQGVMVNVGAPSGVGSPSAPQGDSTGSLTLAELAADKDDRKPGLLFETAVGRNPAGANPPKATPGESFNR